MLQPETSGRFSWPVALTLVVLIVTGAVVLIFVRLETWPARTIGQGTEDLERLGKDLRSAFIDIAHLQPRITVNNRTVVDEATSTAELAILTRQAEIVGIEEKQVDVLRLENGLWNRITGADLENELAQLPEMARRQAMEIELPAEAEKELQRQLTKRIHARQALKLVFTNAARVESPVTNQ